MGSDIDETNRALELNQIHWKGRRRSARTQDSSPLPLLPIQLMRLVNLAGRGADCPFPPRNGSGLLTHRRLNAAGGFNKALVPKFKHQQGPKQLAVVGDAAFMLVL